MFDKNCRNQGVCIFSCRELEVLTANWFYFQSSKKHKRCGSAKVIRELHKREQELGKFNK